MADRLSFGELLRQLRVAAGLTQEALAERAGLSVRAISSLERGDRRAPYRHTVQMLARALGLDAEAGAALAAAAVHPRATAARSDPPPATPHRPVAAAPLPVPLTSFIGRERELAAAWLPVSQGARLLTLTGPGGAGKTRLAVEGARTVRDRFPDGVWFVDLTSLTAPALVAQTVAAALGVHESPAQTRTEGLAAAIAGRRALLVLDNCEHLITACAELVSTLLGACPRLTIVATSREPLAVTGEFVYPVTSLALPGEAEQEPAPGLPTAASLSRYAAVALFVERARAVQPDFALTEHNAAAVVEICRRLDGLPLAIELAAARVRVLTPEQIAARLSDRFRLLVGGPRDLAPRHQTLGALLDWSHELLTVPEQVLFRRLAVFAGGWTLDAAEAVCSDGDIEPADVLDLLTGLVDRSLVVVEPRDGDTRYRMFETIRAYAAAKLGQSSDEEQVRARHRDWFLLQAERGVEATGQAARSRWITAMAADHDNLRAAFERSLTRNSAAEAALRLTVALWEFFVARHFLTEARDWLDRALAAAEREGSAQDLRARAYAQISIISFFAGEYDAGIEAAQTALALSGAGGDAGAAVQAMRGMALCVAERGESEQALHWLEQALQQAQAGGEVRASVMVLHNLGLIALERNDLERAHAWLEEAVGAAAAADDAAEGAFGHALLGFRALMTGDREEARARFRESLVLVSTTDYVRNASYGLLGLAVVAGVERQYMVAARLLAIWEGLRDRYGLSPNPSERAMAEQLRHKLDAAGAAEAYEAAATAGRTITFEQAVRYGLEASQPAHEPVRDASA